MEIENPFMVSILDKMHSVAKFIGDISVDYSNDNSSNFNGILTDYDPNFFDKFFDTSNPALEYFVY